MRQGLKEANHAFGSSALLYLALNRMCADNNKNKQQMKNIRAAGGKTLQPNLRFETVAAVHAMHDSLGSANVQLGAISRGLKRSGEQAAGICDYAAHDAAQVSARRRLHAIQARGRDESENALSATKS